MFVKLHRAFKNDRSRTQASDQTARDLYSLSIICCQKRRMLTVCMVLYGRKNYMLMNVV